MRLSIFIHHTYFLALSSFSSLTHSRHNTLSLGSNSILTPPQTRHRLCLSKERKTRFAVEGTGTASSYRLLVAGEGEHGKRYGDGNVDADLTGFDVALEAGGCGA